MKKILILFSLLVSGMAQAQVMGALQVNGQAGKFQLFAKVKAVRCEAAQRGVCDAPVYFALNQAQALAAGTYLVGYENSMNPGLVTVASGQTTTLNLERLAVPANVRGAKIRVYRDFSSPVEQAKIRTSMFYMKRHFFRLDKNNFGDLYLAGTWERDFVMRFGYEFCGSIKSYELATVDAKQICAAVTNAQRESDLAVLFTFKNDGTFVENWVTAPGDVIPSNHPRYLVSAPLTDQDFVSVFPGVYKFQAEGKNQPAISVQSGGGLY